MKNPQDIKVLLVEDDYLAGEMIKEILSNIGYIVLDRATDGSQAVEMMKNQALCHPGLLCDGRGWCGGKAPLCKKLGCRLQNSFFPAHRSSPWQL